MLCAFCTADITSPGGTIVTVQLKPGQTPITYNLCRSCARLGHGRFIENPKLDATFKDILRAVMYTQPICTSHQVD
jgi:hypothetical protein